MSLRATRNFRKTWIFKIHAYYVGKGKKRKVYRQTVGRYYVPPLVVTPCRAFVRQAFANATQAYQALTEEEKAPFHAYVKHYGLVMHARNLFISRFMKKALVNPANPCDNPPRIDYRKLRRTPGRS